MPVLENDEVRVELDERWPRTVRLTRLETNGSVGGCDPAAPFALELNRERFEEGALACRVEAEGEEVDYVVEVAALALALRFRFTLEGDELVLTLPEVAERGGFRLEKLYVPDHRLVTGTAAAGDSFLRHVTRRRNWSADWCPGTGTYDQWEDLGEVGGGTPERGGQTTNHACVWNGRVCAAVSASICVEPLVTALSAEGSAKSGRAGRFSIWAGTYSYRLRGEPARPLEVRIGLLGDYDGDGQIGWCDAANWEGDLHYAGLDPMYKETIVYKVRVGTEGEPYAVRTFAECLELIKMVHEACLGLPQIVYLVGWQYDGHDTGYPSLAVVNPKCGGRDALVKLIDDARAFGATVSLHVNFDSCYPIHPEWREGAVSRDGEGNPLVWYTKPHRGGRKVYSMNHTKDFESGFFQDRMTRLMEMLPNLTGTLHPDAFRPYGEAWEPDGGHIDAECEVQRGMVPILRWLGERGIDTTTEDSDDEKRGLFKWVLHQSNWTHRYKAVMYHGRVLGWGRAGLRGGKEGLAAEGAALGLGRIASMGALARDTRQDVIENFYLHWMYYQVLNRKKITGYRVGDWKLGVRAWYDDDTWVHGEPYPYTVEADYEGAAMARGTDRFLPWREDTIYAFSLEGGEKEWTLPARWEGAEIAGEMLRWGGPMPGPDLEIEGRTVRFLAPAGVPVRLTRKT